MAASILIADDNQDSAESLAMFLELSGYRVDTAFDGGEALEMAQRNQYDVIFLDIEMPRLTGHQVCKKLIQDGYKGVLGAITGSSDGEEVTKNSGFAIHFTKPVDPTIIESTLINLGVIPG